MAENYGVLFVLNRASQYLSSTKAMADNEKDAFTLMCKIYNKLWETYGAADLEDVTMMLYDETEG